ncbi:hypothetical protein CABS01_16631 [Colletotrichum abscissum]|uniref:Uncharacterized protein n=1 Tax=Colletotrichum abscissum TaxID=1671311 RepID=A0A9Q0AW33_9PEZI|nr:uncharacterized protein CABS01_16631 [Colletotrichum abscissum]KAI3527775.1 hypothetical protein CABS02_15289 [Colletotrichum abscissum]KAK1519057.1 hypothetical protein CABS01_16631 [Colletotrichum abscissum]
MLSPIYSNIFDKINVPTHISDEDFEEIHVPTNIPYEGLGIYPITFPDPPPTPPGGGPHSLVYTDTSKMLFVKAPVGEEKSGKKTATATSGQKKGGEFSSAVNGDSKTTAGPFELPGCSVQDPATKCGSSALQPPGSQDPAKRSS